MKFTVKSLWVLISCTVAISIKAEADPSQRFCEEMVRSEPCEKYDRIIDDLDIRERFHELWLASDIDQPIN